MAILILFFCFSLFQSDMEDIILEDLKWKNRIVILFDDHDNKKVLDFGHLEEDLKERKLVYFIVGENFQSNSNFSFSPEYQKVLKSRYQIPSTKKSWVLIGLDGGAKVKKEGDLDWEFILRTIDSMPMRQSEIRDGK
jgi:hypothetical protein